MQQNDAYIPQQLVAYIGINRFGNFQPIIADAVMAKRSSRAKPAPMLLTLATATTAFVQLEYAQEQLQAFAPAGATIYTHPVAPDDTGLTWFATLKKAQPIAVS